MADQLTAREKIALSRAELMAAMGYRATYAAADMAAAQHLEATRTRTRAPTLADRVGAKLGLDIVGRWWRRHPMSSVVQLSTPLLESYAAHHPGRLLAYSAGTGALLVILKPWRLLSAATVLALLFRTSDVAGLLGDLVARSRGRDDDDDFSHRAG